MQTNSLTVPPDTSPRTPTREEGDGRVQPQDVGLAWPKRDGWSVESRCKRYCIQKFAAGEDVLTHSTGFRYRVLKNTDYWQFEFGPTEVTREAAQAACAAHFATEGQT